MLGFLVFLWLTFVIVSIAAYKNKWVAREGLAKTCVYLGLAVLLVYFWGDNKSIKTPKRELFPASQVVGAVTPVRLTVDEVQHNKSVRGGDLVLASSILPKSIKNEQMRPTELAVLQSLKNQYPNCEWFQIWFSDDDRLYNSGHYLGKAEYKEGSIELSGGVITDKDIAEFKGEIWKPAEEDIRLVFEFYKVNQAAEKAHQEKVASLSNSGQIKAAQKESLRDPITDKEVFKIVSKKTGISESLVSRSVKNTYTCYSTTQFRAL